MSAARRCFVMAPVSIEPYTQICRGFPTCWEMTEWASPGCRYVPNTHIFTTTLPIEPFSTAWCALTMSSRR